MNPLLARLSRLRRRLRLEIGVRGSSALLILLVGGAVLFGVADWFFDLPSLLRALALVTMVGAAYVIFQRIFLVPLASRCDDLSLALKIEAHYLELNDALASTVQFLHEPELTGSSASLRNVAIQRTLALTEKCDFNRVLSGRGVWGWTLGALLSLLAAEYFYYQHGDFAETALWRYIEPFGTHPWTQISLRDAAHRVAQGQPFLVKAQIAGVLPTSARIEIDGILKSEKIVAIKPDAKPSHSGVLVSAIDMTRQKGTFRFRIHANDGTYPPERGKWHEVEVLPPPRFAPLDGAPSPQLEFRYPAYTDLDSPARKAPGSKQIAGVAGMQVSYRAAFDRSLESAWIEFRPENPSLPALAALGALGQRYPLHLALSLSATQATWGPLQARFEDEKKQVLAVDFVPWILGTYSYVLHVRDELGLAVEFVADISMRPDPLPVIQLQAPGSSISVLPDAEIGFKMSVSDEEFAVRSVFFEFRKKDAEHRWLDEGPRRRYLYEHTGLEKALPALLTGFAGWSVPNLPLRLRPKNLEIVTRWPLSNQFKEGEIVVLQIAAEDFCDLFPDRPPGRSHEIELHIVGKAELARILDDGLGKAQQDLVRFQQLQEQALNLVKDLQQKRQKNKQSARDLDQLIEAEQLQKQIQERLGNTSEEGLRNELAKMQQLIKENKLPASEITDQIKTLKNELERLAREDLQQIEPHLAEARKEISGGSDAKDKKSALDKARKLQEQTKQSLDELAKFLDPWAGMHQVRGETRDLLDKQKEVQKGLTKNQDARAELDNTKDAKKISKAEEEVRDDLVQKEEAQRDLSARARKLLDMMNTAKARREEEDRQRLEKAATIGENLPDDMKKTAIDMKNNHPNEALRRQDDNIKALEKMLAALESRKEDDVDRLKKKQKDAAGIKENVNKLAEAQEKLQKKVKDANKISDPQEKARELKRLAGEQEKLKEEVQKNARELARLQEERAANALDRAAQEMDRAAQRLEDGQDPDEIQDEALDRLEDAQAKLEQFEEELAREQLTRIADRIKGIKERQDAAVERSKELHKKVMVKNKWTSGLVETLGAEIGTQRGLADETRALKEKLKDAKVFEHVFEKAAQGMEKAAELMKERRDTGKHRALAEFEKDEITDENNKATLIEKDQALASRRLQRLLDSLKNDRPDVAQKDEPKKQEGEGAGQGGGSARPGDGIPPMAQLKVLRAEQLEINERTQELAKQDFAQLGEGHRRELRELETEQGRLHRLFEEMTTAAEHKGDLP